MIFERTEGGRWKSVETNMGGGVCFALPFEELERLLSGRSEMHGVLLQGEFIERIVINENDSRLHIYIGKHEDKTT